MRYMVLDHNRLETLPPSSPTPNKKNPAYSIAELAAEGAALQIRLRERVGLSRNRARLLGDGQLRAQQARRDKADLRD